MFRVKSVGMVDKSSAGIGLIGIKFDGDAGGEVFQTETIFQIFPEPFRTFQNILEQHYDESTRATPGFSASSK